MIDSRGPLMSEILVRPRVFPVASPAYLARYPAITSLEDLSQIALIHEESTMQWTRWFELAGLDDLPPLRGQRLWHAHLAIEAARLGQGVALANDVLVEEDLRSGALVEVITSSVYMETYQLVALKERWDDPAIVALRNWLKQVLAELESDGVWLHVERIAQQCASVCSLWCSIFRLVHGSHQTELTS